MKNLPMGDFNKILNSNVKVLATSASSISTIMSSSKGRDKICALIQTAANFFIHCIKYSNIDSIQAEFNSNTITSYQIGEKIKESMSKGRKIFKFLKFLQEIKGLQKNMKKKKRLAYKLLSMSINIMAFFYYLLDNILWGIDIGVLSNAVNKNTESIYKGYKNRFSYMKFVLKIIKNVINLVLRQRKENDIEKGMKTCDEKAITVFDDSYDLCRVYLKERGKKRFEMLEIIISSMRIVPLSKSLKLPGYKWLNPVFVSFCGMGSAILKILHLVFSRAKSADEKKEINQDIKEENGEIDVQQFFSKTKTNLKSSKVRNKIKEKDKTTSKGSLSESSDDDDNKCEKNGKNDSDNTKNMMADFMRKSLNAKSISMNTIKKTGGEDNKKEGLRRRSGVLGGGEIKNELKRRSGVLAGEDRLKMSHGSLTKLEEQDKD